MNEQQAKQYIEQRISVTRHHVTSAKAFIAELSRSETSSAQLVHQLCVHMEAIMPDQVVLHPSVDSLSILEKAAVSLSWQAAACEAIWELIHSSTLIPMSDADSFPASLKWTTVTQTSGGHSGGWRFDEVALPVPRTVKRPFSTNSSTDQPLTNYDLYVHELKIVNMHADVELALKEAVRCFRHELFTAALAMLGKGSEGAWLELGEALLQAVPSTEQSKVEKQRKSLENPDVGIGKKIQDVLTLYERQDIFKPIAEQSGVSLQELRIAAVWSDTVRDSRNTIHFGVQPAMANTYEKVATLLISAVSHLRLLYRIKDVADTISLATV